MVLFTHNVIKIKSAAHKNGDVDSTYKQASKVTSVDMYMYQHKEIKLLLQISSYFSSISHKVEH